MAVPARDHGGHAGPAARARVEGLVRVRVRARARVRVRATARVRWVELGG